MSQQVGVNFLSRIPSLGDDADITEALKVYHYGTDDFSGGPVPANSIEGHFISLSSQISTTNSNLTSLGNSTLRRISQSSSPNIITAQSTTTTPLTVRAIVDQTSNLQLWENSSSSAVALITTGGYIATSSYLSVGSTSTVATTAVNVSLASNNHKGIVVRASSGQTSSLQEWQNSSSTVLASISASGELNSKNATIDGTLVVNQSVRATSPSSGGGVSILANSSENSVLQFMNNANNSELANITATSSKVSFSKPLEISGNISAIGTGSTVSSENLSVTGTATIGTLNVNSVTTGAGGYRDIHYSTSIPTSAQGSDGDVWLVYA